MSDVAAPAKAAKGLWGRTKARLGKKVGPFPLWVWIGVGGLGVWWYIRRQNAASATTAASTTTAADPTAAATDPLADGTTDTGSTGSTGGGGTTGGDGTTGGGNSPTVDTTPAVAPSGADASATPFAPLTPGPIAGAPSARGAPKDSLIATSRTGAKLYETSTGAILEQVKGKSPFRVAAAGSAAAKRILANVTKPGNPLRTAGATAKVAAKPRPKAKAAPARHTAHVVKKTVRPRNIGGRI